MCIRDSIWGVLCILQIKGFANRVGWGFYVYSRFKDFIITSNHLFSMPLCVFNVKSHQHSDNTYLFTVYLRFDDSESTLSLFFSSLFPSEDIQYVLKKIIWNIQYVLRRFNFVPVSHICRTHKCMHIDKYDRLNKIYSRIKQRMYCFFHIQLHLQKA